MRSKNCNEEELGRQYWLELFEALCSFMETMNEVEGFSALRRRKRMPLLISYFPLFP